MIRAEKPLACRPLELIDPEYTLLPSINNGSCALPLASDVMVVVVDAELTKIVFATSLRIRRIVPAGLVNCRPVAPSAAVSWAVIDPMPPEKSTPTT